MVCARSLRVAWCALGAVGLLLCAAPASALDPARALTQYAIERWTTRHGLPKNTVQAIAQTPDGYLWVGTEAGLTRFDGVRFVVFAHPDAPELNHASITSLYVSQDGALWLGTDDGWVARLNNGRIRVYRAPRGTAISTIRGLIEDAQGSVWVGAWEGVFLVEGQALRKLPHDVDAVYKFAIDRAARLWAATRGGLVQVSKHGVRGAEGLPGNAVYGLWPAREGGLWLASAGAVVRYDEGAVSTISAPSPVPGALLRSVVVDRNDNLWVGGWGGLARVRGTRFDPMPAREGLVDQAVVAVFEDREGSVWIGTRGGGLSRLRDSLVITHSTSEGLTRADVQGVLADQRGRVWVGVSDAGVNVFEHGTWRMVDETPLLAGTQLLSIGEDPAGRVYFGTEDGLIVRDGTRYSRVQLPGLPADPGIDSVFTARGGGVWVCANEVLFHVDGSAARVIPYPRNAIGAAYLVLAEGDSGTLWLGTPRGLATLRDGMADLVWKNPSPQTRPVTLAVDPDGSVWAGSRGGGLVHVTAGATVSYTRQGGLPDDWILELVDDGAGALWMATHVGIVVVRKGDLGPDGVVKESRILGLDEGMRSNYADDTAQPSMSRGPDGRLWVTTTHGVTSVDPAQLPTAVTPPRVVVESVRVDGREILGQSDAAAPGRGMLTVTYTATSLVSPHRVQFEYQLEGFDERWIDAGSGREAHFTNLPPGSYTFRVAAREAFGAWRVEARPVTVTLEPHFYETLWARAVGLLSILAAFGWLVWLRGRRTADQQRRLAALVDTRTHELQLEVAEHRATEHALRQSEALLQRAHDQLETRVHERTRALQLEVAERRRAEAELTVARDAAEEASRAKSAFVANMSHELRTPLNAVIGYAEIVSEDLTDHGLVQSRVDVERIRTAGTHLLSLVSDILDLSKVEAGRMELTVEGVDITAILGDVASTVQPLAERNGNTIRIEDGSNQRRMRTDATRLRQVLLNLASNACKFTSDGDITIGVAWVPGHEGDTVRFWVADTGIGIAAADFGRLFHEFAQLDASTTRRYGGTGLGLALSRRLCRLLGGEIAVDSTVGKGSCFTVELPADLAAQDTDAEMTVA